MPPFNYDAILLGRGEQSLLRLRIDGGDGDQSYFSEPMYLEIVERNWFKLETPLGVATLTQVLSGRHSGEYIALTSRVLSSIDERLALRKWASVVVNVVKKPGPDFEPTLGLRDAVGMSFVELVV